MVHVYEISTTFPPIETKIIPALILTGCNDYMDEKRFRGISDLIMTYKGAIHFHKDVKHISMDNPWNGWFYPNEINKLPDDKNIKKAWLELGRTIIDFLPQKEAEKIFDYIESIPTELPF